MRYRKLRIAWSVAWGVVAVLLFALWVRSYWITDGLSYTKGPTYVGIFTSTGIAGLNFVSWTDGTMMSNKPGFEWITYISRADRDVKPFSWVWRPEGPLITIPVWCCESVLVLLAALPWLRWRFSLRTMLITTTLVAVWLGLAVYTLRK